MNDQYGGWLCRRRGSEEDEIEIPNLDLCDTGCNNPPYTLYRFTLDEDGRIFDATAPEARLWL